MQIINYNCYSMQQQHGLGKKTTEYNVRAYEANAAQLASQL